MAHEREETFRRWSKAPSDTEDERCQNAETVVRNAIRAHPPFKTRSIEVFVQGSYANGTNVRSESDVDICVLCTDVCFTQYPTGWSDADAGLVDSPHTYADFKNEVERALRNYLPSGAKITRGDKAIDLHENTYRVDADVVAAFEHRRYSVNGGYTSGTEFRSDSGKRIINWPRQNRANGNAKNEATRTRFKKLVRVVKNLRNEMVAAGKSTAAPIPSYLIECLVWNAPDEKLDADADYADNLDAILRDVYFATKDDAPCSEWGEVNELKYLFRTSQPWTRQAVNDFVASAWSHAGFK